jgi:hypothetical protein
VPLIVRAAIRSLILLLAALALLSGCAVSGTPLTEEERCTIWGGIWRLGVCRSEGDSGGSM